MRVPVANKVVCASMRTLSYETPLGHVQVAE